MEITEQLTLLAELSFVEERIRAHRLRQETIPAEANKAQADAEDKKKAFAVVDQERLNVDKQRNDQERSLSEARDHLKKWNLRLDKIRDEREHAALLSEVGAQKRSISRLENDILELMQQIEDLEKSAEAKKAEFDEATQNATDEFAKVEGELKEIEAALAIEEKARDGLTSKLPETLVKKYQRIAERRQGQAVAVIHGEVCNACHTALPPQLCLLVYKGALIDTCPTCSRILVHESMTRSESTDDATAEASA